MAKINIIKCIVESAIDLGRHGFWQAVTVLSAAYIIVLFVICFVIIALIMLGVQYSFKEVVKNTVSSFYLNMGNIVARYI